MYCRKLVLNRWGVSLGVKVFMSRRLRLAGFALYLL